MKRWSKTVEAEYARRQERDPRIEWGALANLVDLNGRHIPVIVENISKDGVLLISDHILISGKTYQLADHRSEDVSVHVIWVKGCFAGAKIESKVRAVA